jgi:hypothetical protein
MKFCTSSSVVANEVTRQKAVTSGAVVPRQHVRAPHIVRRARRPQFPVEMFRQQHEDQVGFHRPHDLQTCRAQAVRQPVGHVVGVTRQRQPVIVGQESVELGGKIAML